MGKIFRKSVAFENRDISTVMELASKKGLGSRGFSAAIRMIIREWEEQKSEQRARITEAGQSALHDAQEHEPEP